MWITLWITLWITRSGPTANPIGSNLRQTLKLSRIFSQIVAFLSDPCVSIYLVREENKMECNECEYWTADFWAEYKDGTGEFICSKCLTQVDLSAILSLSDYDRELVLD